MKPAPFVYHAPHSLAEAVALLARHREDGGILAGGQSLVPIMAFRLAQPGHLIDINGVAELDYLRIQGGMLRIGALTRHAAFHRPPVDGPLGALLGCVVRHIAHYPIRTRGTFCGSLAHADPASEWCLVAATLGAELVMLSAHGERAIGVDEYFEGMMATSRAPDEILVETRLPLLPSGTRWGFYEFSRRAGDYALAMALVVFEVVDHAIAEARIGIGGVEAAPRRVPEAELALAGCAPTAEVFQEAAAVAAAAVDPLEDLQASADYRRDLVRAVTRRALARAVA